MEGNFHLYDVDWGLGRIYPPYQVGDYLYVRETWQRETEFEWCFNYKASDENLKVGKWHSSIYMPKKAARLFIKVTAYKIEQLQDITEEDAEKEGVKAYGPNNCSGTSARIAFAELWDSIYQSRGHGWDKNDWVIATTFERVIAE
jgi:hypothetical protein